MSIVDFFRINRDWLSALLITLISSAFALLAFFTVEFKEFFGFERAYTIALILIFLQLSSTYLIVSLYNSIGFFRKVSIWLQTNVVSLFALLYYVRLNDSNLSIGDFSLTTRFVVVALLSLIFLVNYNLFGNCKKRFPLIVAQVAFFLFSTFSFLAFAQGDKTIKKDFTSDILDFVFHIHPLIWLFITATAISLVSIFPVNRIINNVKRTLSFFFLSILINFQILLSVYLLSITELGEGRLTYWYLTLLALIFWDLFYYPVINVIKDVIDYKFKQRIFVSSLYHILLFMLVLFYDPILDLFKKILG